MRSTSQRFVELEPEPPVFDHLGDRAGPHVDAGEREPAQDGRARLGSEDAERLSFGGDQLDRDVQPVAHGALRREQRELVQGKRPPGAGHRHEGDAVPPVAR